MSGFSIYPHLILTEPFFDPVDIVYLLLDVVSFPAAHVFNPKFTKP